MEFDFSTINIAEWTETLLKGSIARENVQEISCILLKWDKPDLAFKALSQICGIVEENNRPRYDLRGLIKSFEMFEDFIKKNHFSDVKEFPILNLKLKKLKIAINSILTKQKYYPQKQPDPKLPLVEPNLQQTRSTTLAKDNLIGGLINTVKNALNLKSVSQAINKTRPILRHIGCDKSTKRLEEIAKNSTPFIVSLPPGAKLVPDKPSKK